MKKVLTVFLSIALVLAMMPAMAFANGNAEPEREDLEVVQVGQIVLFNAERCVVDNNIISLSSDADEGKTLEYYAMTETTLYPMDEFTVVIAQKVGENNYKAVEEAVTANNNDVISIEKDSERSECYNIKAKSVGTATLGVSGNNNTITVEVELPDVGCYSSIEGEESDYLGHSFDCNDKNGYSFYIVAKSESDNITKARFVKEYIENEEMEDVTGVTISGVDDKNNVRKVTVNADAFTDEKQELSGDLVVNYGEGSCSSFSFFIYGPNYNPDDEDITPNIEFYSDEECSEEIDDFSVNTSLEPKQNYFYIKSPDGEPNISEIITHYTEWNSNAKKMISYTGRFDCTKANATEKYAETDEYGKEKTEAYVPKTNVNDTTGTKPGDFVEIATVDSEKGIYKLAFKAAKTYSYRGHERMSFKITAGEEGNLACRYLDVDYGLNILYNEEAFGRIMPTGDYFDYILETGMSSPSFKKVEPGKVYWGNLGGQSSNITARCGEEVIIALDTANGYSIESIKNAVNGKELPCTIQAEYYYKVYDGDTEIIANDDLLNENREFDLGSISSWDDDNIKYAFWALQRVGKTSAYTGDFFKVGVENVTALKNFCEQKNYTAKLIGYALSYTVFVPVYEQCKIQITTKKVDNINEISTVQVNNSFGAKSVTATSAMQTNLDNYYKQGKEITGVYELTAGNLNSTVDVVIPVEGNPSDYEIVWFKDEDTPVPTVTRYLDGAVMFTTGHFSTYAIVKNKSNTPAGGGGITGGGAVMPPAADEDDVKTTKDSTTSETKTSTTVKDTKTETVKNEQGEEISKVTATVSEKVAEKLVDAAVSNKSDTVEITVKSNDGNKAAQTEVEIPKKALESIAKDTDADLVITTENGHVTLDNKTLETIAAEAEGDTVKITVNENTQLKEAQKSAADAIGKNGKLFDIKAVIGDRIIHDFKGGKAHVTLPMPEKLKGKDIVIIYINDKGICEILNHTMETVGAEKYIKFTTSHFSTFAVVEKADADKLIEQQNAEKINSLIKEAKLKATTSKTSKKNVEIKVSVKNNNSLIKEAKAMGYTVKYKFYRSTKKASKYKAVKTRPSNSYINTAGKKGTRYYYKAKVLVYDGKTLIAQTELKQCSYGARTWNK